jgi:hypothetical protein
MMILKTSRSNLSSNDRLSLDLPFAATKSIAARVGPTPTFSRASGATYIGSDGLIHGVDTSTTSNSISAASKTFTLAATAGQDQLWRAGDAVEASNGSNFMVGTVTSYTPSTQSLVCNMTSIGGTGTFTSWRIGYRGPRFDHTSAGVCRGLLIEESRTNLLSRSEEFGTTWTAVQLNTTGTPAYLNVATAPDGATTADKLIATTTTTTHQFRQSVTLVSGTTYTVSNYFKAAEQKFVSFQLFGVANGSNDWLAYFDVSTATPTAGAFNGFTSISITNAGNGWFRCTGTFTATASGTLEVRIGGAGSLSTGGQFYTGDGTSGIFLWGAQLEAGSFPTSYIPTTTGTLARSADVCSITGGNFTGMWNQSEGTLLAQTQKTSTNSNAFIISASDNSFNNETDLRYNSVSQPSALINVSGAAQVTGFQANITSGSAVKQSLAYKLNDCAYSANGASVITDTSALIPTVDRLTIGNVAFIGQSFYLNGHIAAVRYYKKRLPNAKLVTLTT